MQEKIQNISPVKQRILQFVEYLNITKRDFYKKTGISRGTLESNTGITESTLAKLFATYPILNKNWVNDGSGSMLREYVSSVVETNEVKEPCETYNIKEEGIPLIPISAMAGFGTGECQILEYECERYVIPMFTDAEFLISVKGDSMYPRYASGDVVACKKVPVDTFLQWNKVYVLDTEQGALIKRIRKGNDVEHILIVSDNKEYEPFEMPVKKINSIAIVVGVIRLE